MASLEVILRPTEIKPDDLSAITARKEAVGFFLAFTSKMENCIEEESTD